MEHQRADSMQTPTGFAVKQWRRRLYATGLAMIVLGTLAIVMPIVSSYTVIFLIGTVLTFGGLLAVLLALPFRGTPAFVWMLFAGMFPLCAGLYFLVFPASGLTTLTFVIAAILLLTGVSQSVSAFNMRGIKGSVWVFMSGLISIGLSVLIFAVLPEASTVLLGILLGIDLITTGVSLVLLTSAMPHVAKHS